MTLQECTALLAPLALALRADMDDPTFRAYHRALSDVPVNLLQAAVDHAMRSNSAFLPRPGELRALAERARLELSFRLKFEGCAQCHGTGWEQVLINGVPRAQRCQCWKAHQSRLEREGVTLQPVAQLIAGGDEPDAA